MPMKVRETILSSERRPGGAVTMVRLTVVDKQKAIQLIQTRGNAASEIVLDNKEYKALVKFVANKRKVKKNAPRIK